MIPGLEALGCGPLAVPVAIMEHIVRVESSRNPYAIGVVGGRLERQPRTLGEAVATLRMLEDAGRNYSVGLAQVNRANLKAQGLDTPERAFDPCANLAAGARILADCHQRHGGHWGDAFSCYYSGNARTGYRHGYVARVFASMSGAAARPRRGGAPSSAASAIPGPRGAEPMPPAPRPVTAIEEDAARVF